MSAERQRQEQAKAAALAKRKGKPMTNDTQYQASMEIVGALKRFPKGDAPLLILRALSRRFDDEGEMKEAMAKLSQLCDETIRDGRPV